MNESSVTIVYCYCVSGMNILLIVNTYTLRRSKYMTFLLAHTPFVSRTWVLSQANLLFCTILSRESGSGTLVDCARRCHGSLIFAVTCSYKRSVNTVHVTFTRRCHGSLIFAVTCSYKRSVNTVHVTFTRRRHTVLLFIPICAKRPHMCVCVCVRAQKACSVLNGK